MRTYSYESTLRLHEQYGRHPRKGEITIRERRAFGPLACAYLEGIGAIPGNYYDFRIETEYGWLELTPYDNWIACRFDEVKRAEPIIGHSYSGKWNFHSFSARLVNGRPTAATLLELLRDNLEGILLSPVEAVA